MTFASACTWDFSHNSGPAFGTVALPLTRCFSACMAVLCCVPLLVSYHHVQMLLMQGTVLSLHCTKCLGRSYEPEPDSWVWVPYNPKSVMDIENARMCCRKIQTDVACLIFPFCTFLLFWMFI